jgi:fumarate hydratase class I
MSSFNYTEILPLEQNSPEYRLITTEGITTTTIGERTFLNIDASVLEKVAYEAIHDISHYLRTSHLEQLKKIIDDKQIVDVISTFSNIEIYCRM